MALYTKGFTFYEPISQHGDLNIYFEKLFQLSFDLVVHVYYSGGLLIYKALVLWTADSEFKSAGDLLEVTELICKSHIFIEKSHTSFAFKAFISITCYLNFIELYRLYLKTLIQVCWATLNLNRQTFTHGIFWKQLTVSHGLLV